MKPYGELPGTRETRESRPRSGMVDWSSPFGDEGLPLSPDTIRRVRRRLKKKARQEARKQIRENQL